jgi:hypothetical protein
LKTVINLPSALLRLCDAIEFLCQQLPEEKTETITNRDRAVALTTTYELGCFELGLGHLGKGHRRLIEGNFKIVYRVDGDVVYVTDIFDSRQDPDKVKG